jgi:DNA (cytosine-5)-methyltransferase 1
MKSIITSGDFLAGGGGVTEAMAKIEGLHCKWVLNHDPMAIRTNLFNHPKVKHYWADLYKQNEKEMDPVDFAWASIECTQHSKANGGRDKKIGSYTLGWELVRYIEHLDPYILGIENVPEFKQWAPIDDSGMPITAKKGHEFEKWKNTICALGYDYHEKIMNAADYGLSTRRVRYFAFFIKSFLNLNVRWPIETHNKFGTDGLQKWAACKKYINLDDEGNSIFGREHNINIAKGKRKPLCNNTLKRIAGGIKKFAPDLQFVFQYYSNGLNAQNLDAPLNTVTVKDRHVLCSIEKKHFVQDRCHSDNYHLLDDPLKPQLTRQTKQLITLEKIQFLNDYFGRDNTAHSIDGPANTITTENSKNLITIDAKFISKYYSGNRHYAFSPDDACHTITTVGNMAIVDLKAKFISNQRNSNGKPEANNSNINSPLPTISTVEKTQFISAFFNQSNEPSTPDFEASLLNGDIDFDIKMRFLDPEELSLISSFPPKYFSNPRLGLSRKNQTKLIGNAVPPEWARLIIQPVVEDLQIALNKLNIKSA